MRRHRQRQRRRCRVCGKNRERNKYAEEGWGRGACMDCDSVSTSPVNPKAPVPLPPGDELWAHPQRTWIQWGSSNVRRRLVKLGWERSIGGGQGWSHAPCATCRKKLQVEDLSPKRLCKRCQIDNSNDPDVKLFREELAKRRKRKARELEKIMPILLAKSGPGRKGSYSFRSDDD